LETTQLSKNYLPILHKQTAVDVGRAPANILVVASSLAISRKELIFVSSVTNFPAKEQTLIMTLNVDGSI
jgi:hypothetical protein